MKKFLALALALLMILPVLASCSKKNTEEEKVDPSAIKESTSDSETVKYVNEKYGSYKYNGDSFRILAFSPGENYQGFASEESTEIWYEEDSADTLQHAVFTRNVLTEDLLGIKIVPQFGGTAREVADLTQTLVKAGGDEVDLIQNSHTENLPKAMANNFYNLYAIETFDPTEEWWDQDYVNTFTVKKHQLSTITGDYLTMDDYSTPVVFYNKQVVENLSLEDPADLVEAGTWTLDSMMQMAASATSDTSGDGKMDENDSWGLLDNGYSLSHFISGCNAPMTALDDEGVPQVVIEQETFLNAVQAVFEKVSTSPAYLNADNGTDVEIIVDDRGLFYYELLGGIYNFREMESVFSLLPLPKLNEQQETYTSIANGTWCTTLAIPITVKDINKVGVIVSVLGGMSTDTVDKALNEIVLGPNLFRVKRTVEMFDYCVKSRRFDWTNGVSWANPIYSAISDQEKNSTFTFASSLQKNIKVVKAQLKRFIVTYNPAN